MITSEVQRTLVKSPPELWAELSDPTSLARHLGELGEIRITRVDPEQRVEWETTGASGSVAIKPSGWGTKVTLTVQHDGGAGEAPSTPEPASGPSPGEPAGAPEGSDPSPVEATGAPADSGPSPVEPADPPEDSDPSPVDATGAPEDSPHAPAEAAAPLESSSVSGVEPGPEPEPAPAHIAAPKPVTGLASWAAAFGAERSGSTKPAPKARVESDIAPVATGEHDRDLPEARAEQELPPRGLLAWLFRRRRGYAQTETNLPAAARTPAPEELPAEDATSAPGVPASAEPPALEPLDEAPGPEAVAAAPVAPAPAQPRDDGTAGADGPASGGEGPDVEAPKVATLDSSAGVEAPGTDALGANVEAEMSTTDGDANAVADTSNPDAPGAGASPQAPQPHESGADGEHAAERGAEEVTAVLTAVLDRLGAAHHRPFSRG